MVRPIIVDMINSEKLNFSFLTGDTFPTKLQESFLFKRKPDELCIRIEFIEVFSGNLLIVNLVVVAYLDFMVDNVKTSFLE